MSLFAVRNVLCSVLLGWLLMGCQYSPEEPFVDIYDTEHVKEITGWRILPIEKEDQPAALDILGNQAAITLSDQQLAVVFPQQKIDPSALLQKEIDVTVGYAEKRERELKTPFFTNNLGMKKEVEEHRAHAKYLSGLQGKIMPYLIKGKLCSKDKNAGFGASIDLRTGYLAIDQGCLSRVPIVPWVEPVVVFSEVPITKVEATVSIDE